MIFPFKCQEKGIFFVTLASPKLLHLGKAKTSFAFHSIFRNFALCYRTQTQGGFHLLSPMKSKHIFKHISRHAEHQ